MGAETDLSPPPPPVPEPDVRGHDDNQQSWKVDMMTALGESVSFGRFLSEPLEWGKWSAFVHNRYLEEAARQARPGSVAQKKAMFEAHYARKRKMETDAAAAAGAEGEHEEDLPEADGGGAASLSSSAAGSSCMTDEAATEQEVSGGGDPDGAVECGGRAGGTLAGVATEEVEVITDGVGSSRRMNEAAADEICNREDSDALQLQGKQDSCNGHLVSVDAVHERQPLKESSVVNQDVTDSDKKRRLQMPSLFQKPSKLSSPSSGKKGHSSSAKRCSSLHSSKENASPPSTDSSKRSASSVSRKRSTLAAMQLTMSFSRCETGHAASSSRNLGTTIAERISQLQSASRPVENSRLEESRPPRKVISGALPEIGPRTSQVDEQRSSHVMRLKQKLFGSTSPSVTQKIRSIREKQRKPNNEPGFKESRQSFCFKTRPLPIFCWKNKQWKDPNQQNAQEIQHLPNSGHLQRDDHTHQMAKGVSKEKQICCFPIRKLY